MKYLEKFGCSQGQLNSLTIFFFFFNKGRSNHFVFEVVASHFWERYHLFLVSQKRVKNQILRFLFSFSSLYFSSWHRKVCLFESWCRKQHICDPRRNWKICLIIESSDIVSLVWILEVISLKYASSDCILWPAQGSALRTRGCSLWTKRILEPATGYGEEWIWLQTEYFTKQSLLLYERCAPVRLLLKNSREKALLQSTISLWPSLHPVFTCFCVLLFVNACVPSCSP